MLPRAYTHVHGVGGHAERAGARARFAARRAGRFGLGAAKVVLWLLVVTSSLLAIVLLAARGEPRLRTSPSLRDRAAEPPLPPSHRVIEIDHVGRHAH